ncbi:glutamine amidotransferases class-II domain-containing protein [Ditylenchus destructor]|nr:glutamine amidotransferases class-II domain-containing protein [Ditylenchus destructor]
MVILSEEKLAEIATKTLWRPELEKDECGVGFVTSIKGISTHKILQEGRIMLERMAHRGACGCDNDSGDGAGVLTAIPDKLYREELKKTNDIDLPPPGEYATGILFMHIDSYKQAKESFSELARGCDLRVIAWRTLRTKSEVLGVEARKTEPCMRQVFLTADHAHDKERFDRSVYLLRKQTVTGMEKQMLKCYVVSLSSSTIVYKGQFNPYQLYTYYEDLMNPEYVTHIALVHSRFSTNTFPSWSRAQPNRMVAHNGEINTLRGNINLMRAREGVMQSTKYGDDLHKVYPVVENGMTDSGSFDNVLEFLVRVGGRSLPEAAMTMVPEAWEKDDKMGAEKRAFYRWAAMQLEPWDGPALLAFSDGRYVGAILDSSRLRCPRKSVLNVTAHVLMKSDVRIC